MTDEWDIEQLDLPAYLRRVGHDAEGAPSPETLAALHRAHVAAIPFENLDIVLGRGVGVELADVQAKLVHARRGGYCYEHGLLFAAALERLGYDVDRLLARVGGDRERPRGRTHMLLRVRAGSQHWLADVGFGSGLLEPLPFTANGPSRQGGWTLRLAPSGPRAWELHERRGEEWAVLYGFDDQVQRHADVVVANHFTSTWPRSPFVGRLVVVRKDGDALRELVGRTLTLTRPDGRTEDREVDDREFGGTLRDVFGLDLGADDVERLIRVSAAPGP